MEYGVINNGKLETQLNVALDSTETELEESMELGTGYNSTTKEWTLIIRYSGDTEKIRNISESFDELAGGYGIVRIKEIRIEELSSLGNVLYIEKPKKLYYEISEGISNSCINSVQLEPFNLFGDGIIVGVIDSGIDYLNNAFLDGNGKTRIISIWDQTLPNSDTNSPPAGYSQGVEFTKEQINMAINAGFISRNEAYRIVPSRDISGHGTHVAGICCGNFASDKNNNIGIATKASIIIVKLGNENNGFPRTTELMTAIDYVVKKGMELNMPVAINLSFGNNYGSHDGMSLLETFIDTVASLGRTTIVAGSGNEGSSGSHVSGQIINTMIPDEIQLITGNFEKAFNVQLWKSYSDTFEIEITGPSGASTGFIKENNEITRYVIDNTQIIIYFGQPSPYSIYQEIYFDFIPQSSYITEGIWKIGIRGESVNDGKYDMWLPVSNALSTNTRFVRTNPETTLTIPSTASNVISVGAYNTYTDSYADFSGRGYTRSTNQIKPDIVAPGVNILSAAVGGGMTLRSGTSMAAPFVTGGAALLMEWGIINRNDPYLYGEKVKAYLIKGAKQLPGMYDTPNPLTGWGKLCVKDSIPV